MGSNGKKGFALITFVKIFGFHSFVYLPQRRILYVLCIAKMPASRLRL